ncbi:MAG: hypothetical protein HHJ13_07900, partial [Phycicoccus sp.]|nr:hypothetical protein [Phycicoccus sp.]
MRQLVRVICCTAVVTALTACGSQGPANSPSNSPSQPSVFPLTITRVGGIAGFNDVLVVTSDGLVSVTQKGKAQRQCQLTPEAAKRLTTAASEVPWPHLTPGNTTAAFPDDLITMALSPSGGPVRVEDPLVGAAGPIF